MIPINRRPVGIHILGIRIAQIKVGQPCSSVPTLQISRRSGVDFIPPHSIGGHAETKTETSAMCDYTVHGRKLILARCHLRRIRKCHQLGCYFGRGKGSDRSDISNHPGSHFRLIRGGRSNGSTSHHIHHSPVIHQWFETVGHPAIYISNLGIGNFPIGAGEKLHQNHNIIDQLLTVGPSVGNNVMVDKRAVRVKTIPAGHGGKHTFAVEI